jgi:hypothetical protein
MQAEYSRSAVAGLTRLGLSEVVAAFDATADVAMAKAAAAAVTTVRRVVAVMVVLLRGGSVMAVVPHGGVASALGGITAVTSVTITDEWVTLAVCA